MAEHLSKASARRRERSPIVSFTFDDFPKTALTVGGRMLIDHGWRGTYYCALGLMGQSTGPDSMFARNDLDDLLSAGHQLACHTFNHRSCFSIDSVSLVEDCARNRRELMSLLPGCEIRDFSFPNGQATLSAKVRLRSSYDSCRSIAWGVNLEPTDLAYLRANPIYSRYGTGQIQQLIKSTVEKNGWLILYTHEICAKPSPYGCTPEQFAEVLQYVSESGAEVLSVHEAVRRFAPSKGAAHPSV